MSLTIDQFKAKKPRPSHEWMIGYSDGVKYITDGTVLLNWDNCPNPDPWLSVLVNDTHRDNNTGVKATYTKGVTLAMGSYPKCAQLFPQDCIHKWEDTGIIFDATPRGALQRVFYNKEIGYQYANLDYLKNIFHLAGLRKQSQYDAVTITSASASGPMVLSLEDTPFGVIMPITRKNAHDLRLSQDHLGSTVYVVERLNETHPPSRVLGGYFTSVHDARQYIQSLIPETNKTLLVIPQICSHTEPTRVKSESTGEEFIITPLNRDW